MKETFENMLNGGNAHILERILEVLVRRYKNLQSLNLEIFIKNIL